MKGVFPFERSICMAKTVYNGLATSDRKTSAGWLNFWKERKGYAGNRRPQCANTACSNPAEDGGHVSSQKNDWVGPFYIVPLCRECNRKPSDEAFEVEPDDMVPE